MMKKENEAKEAKAKEIESQQNAIQLKKQAEAEKQAHLATK